MLEGADNFQAWQYKISLIFEDNDLDQYNNGELPKLGGYKAKDTHKKNLVKDSLMYMIIILNEDT